MEKLNDILSKIRALGFEARFIPANSEQARGITVNPALGSDFAELSERDFERVLKKCSTIQELEGIANRRRTLGVNLKRWNAWQIAAIKSRKLELERRQANSPKDRRTRR